MGRMKAMRVEAVGELVATELPVPEPERGQVRLKVHACGICHSDTLVTEAQWPELELPRVPGHEVAGVVDAVGEGASRFAVGDRVGAGWHGGHDGTCDACLAGKFIHCDDARITGISFDGGYAEYAVVSEVALAPIPDGIDFAEAGPLFCAGITTYNALRNSDARSGDLVGVQGIGGLGHLGVQFARAMGFEVAAISRGTDKEELARQLGAHHFIDAEARDVGESLTDLGGARVLLATAPHPDAIQSLLPGLGIEGTLLVVAAPFEPIEVGALDLISGDRKVQGWASGTAADSADTLEFAALHDIRPMIETFPLEAAEAGIERMLASEVRFRSVLVISD